VTNILQDLNSSTYWFLLKKGNAQLTAGLLSSPGNCGGNIFLL
jgi:hypothetical protein